MSLIVMTFGPAAVQGDGLLAIGDTLRQSQQAGNAIVAVVDALPGVANLLQQGIELGNYSRIYNKLNSIHGTMARKLIREARDRAHLLQDLEDILGSYQWLGRSIVGRQPTPAEAVTMLATGQRLSAHLLAAYLQHRGLQTRTLHSHEFLITDDDSGTATIDMERSRQRCAELMTPLIDSGALVIVACTGGSNGDNQPTGLAGDSLHLTRESAGGYAAGGRPVDHASHRWHSERAPGLRDPGSNNPGTDHEHPLRPGGLRFRDTAYHDAQSDYSSAYSHFRAQHFSPYPHPERIFSLTQTPRQPLSDRWLFKNISAAFTPVDSTPRPGWQHYMPTAFLPSGAMNAPHFLSISSISAGHVTRLTSCSQT